MRRRMNRHLLAIPMGFAAFVAYFGSLASSPSLIRSTHAETGEDKPSFAISLRPIRKTRPIRIK